MPRARRPPETTIRLTARETDVLRLIAVGCTYAEAGTAVDRARQLGIL